MAYKVKVPPEKRLEAVLRYLNGEIAKISFEQDYGAHSISLTAAVYAVHVGINKDSE